MTVKQPEDFQRGDLVGCAHYPKTKFRVIRVRSDGLVDIRYAFRLDPFDGHQPRKPKFTKYPKDLFYI